MPFRVIQETVVGLWKANYAFIGTVSGLTSGALAFLEDTKSLFGTLGIVCTALIALAALSEKLVGYAQRLIRWRRNRNAKTDAEHKSTQGEPQPKAANEESGKQSQEE